MVFEGLEIQTEREKIYIFKIQPLVAPIVSFFRSAWVNIRIIECFRFLVQRHISFSNYTLTNEA